jgi:hypothetical protein
MTRLVVTVDAEADTDEIISYQQGQAHNWQRSVH